MCYYKYAKFFLNSMLVLLLIGCRPSAEVEVKPNIPPIPLVVAIDSNGQVSVKVSYELRTPIANIELSGGGSREIFSFRQSELVKDKCLLLVRVDNELTVYELVENQEFEIKLQNDEGYREVRLVKESDEDIILELESIGNNTIIAISDITPTRISSTATPTRRLLPTNTSTPQLTPTVPSDMGMIILQGSYNHAGLETQVQWLDGAGGWNDVENWHGQLDNTGRISWLVWARDFNTGPFRWVVYNRDGSISFASQSFYLPNARHRHLINMN